MGKVQYQHIGGQQHMRNEYITNRKVAKTAIEKRASYLPDVMHSMRVAQNKAADVR